MDSGIFKASLDILSAKTLEKISGIPQITTLHEVLSRSVISSRIIGMMSTVEVEWELHTNSMAERAY